MPPRRKRSAADIAADAAKKKKAFEPADDLDVVMTKCRELKAKLHQQAESTVSAADLKESIVEVEELSSSEVMDGMEEVAIKIAQQVMHRQGFEMKIPSRAASNQVYIKEWDRIVLGAKTGTRSFLNVKVREGR